MAQSTFHVNLLTAQFPHNFSELGSTIVAYQSQLEQNKIQSTGLTGEGDEQSWGVCQAYFMQNVLPTTRGFSSIAYTQVLPPILNVPGPIDQLFC